MTLFTVQGKPVLVCICCLTVPILESWEGSGNWDLSTFGERRETGERETPEGLAFLAKLRLERKARS